MHSTLQQIQVFDNMESNLRTPTTQHIEDELIAAIGNGDREKLSKTLESGNVDVKDRKLGRNLLLKACETNNATMVKLLVSHGVEPKKQSPENRGHWLALTPSYTSNPFLVACACPDDSTAVIQILLDAGIDIDTRDERGFTGLIFACLGGNVANVRLLIEKGADVNLEACGYESALVKASYSDKHGSSQIIQMLLDVGADPFALCGDAIVRCILLDNIEGVTILYKAMHGRSVYDGDSWGNILTQHLERASILDSIDPYEFPEKSSSMPVLHLSCAVPSHDAVLMVKKLLDMGANIHERDITGFSCLQHAASSMHLKTVRLLLDKGANPADDGWHPLWRSLPGLQKDNIEDYLKVLLLLLASGFRLDKESAQMFKLAAEQSDIPKKKQRDFHNVIARYSNTVLSLKDMCRIRIRQCLHKEVSECVDTLSEDLPHSVLQYLRFADI